MGKRKIPIETDAAIMQMYQSGISASDIIKKLDLNVRRPSIAEVIKRNGGTPNHPGRPSRSIPLSVDTLQVVYGMILGDGHLTDAKPPHVNSRIDVEQSICRPDFLQWIAAYLEKDGIATSITPQKDRDSNRLYSACSREFSELRSTWYKDGEKIVPIEFDLSRLSLSSWYMSDGTREKNRNTVVLYTNRYDIGSINNLLSAFEKIGIKANIHTKKSHINSFKYVPGKTYKILYIPKRYSGVFFDFIGDCPVESFRYKWPDQ